MKPPNFAFLDVKIMGILFVFIEPVLIVQQILLNAKKLSNKFIQLIYHYCLELYVIVEIVKHLDFVETKVFLLTNKLIQILVLDHIFLL